MMLEPETTSSSVAHVDTYSDARYKALDLSVYTPKNSNTLDYVIVRSRLDLFDKNTTNLRE